MTGKMGCHSLIMAFIAAISFAAATHTAHAAPLVNFENGTGGYFDYVFVNASASDPSNNVSLFIDFDDSLVSWWRMDDVNQTGPGSIIYDYTGRNNGTALGTAQQTDAGYFGKGFEFDGSGDWINLGNPNSLDFGSSMDFTVGLWVKGNADDNIDKISFGHYYSTGEFQFGNFNSSGHIRYRVRDSTGKTLNLYSNAVILDNQWHHVMAVSDRDDNATIYVDGVYDGSTSMSQIGNITGSNPWAIGRQGGASPYDFNGTIDDVMIFNRTLSAVEITALYANQTSKYTHANFTNLSYWISSFTAYAQDTLGNVNSTQRSVILSAYLPQVTILSPLETNYYTKTIDLNWSVDGAIDWAGYSLNGAGNVTLTPQNEQDAEDSYSCSGSFLMACSNATDEDWNTYAECSSGSSCFIYENTTIPGPVSWANWSYRIYKVDGISSYSTQYWNYSAGGWNNLDTTGTAEGFYWRNVTIPADGLSGPVLRIRNPIESFVVSKQQYYEGKVSWKYAYNRTISAKSGTNHLIVYANDSTGGTGSSEVWFEYVPPPTSIQLILRLDNLANEVYVPGTGTIASASITNSSYGNPTHWYLASYLNNSLNALVFSYQEPAMLEVNRSSSSHKLVMSQNLENSKSLLVFTSGDWQAIDNRMGLIEEMEFMNEISPSFSYGLGISYLVKVLLSYPDIKFNDNMTFGKGFHDIIFYNMGIQDRNVLLGVSST